MQIIACCWSQKPWQPCFPPGLLPLPSGFITPAAQRCEEGTGASKCGAKAKGTGLHIDRWLGDPGWGARDGKGTRNWTQTFWRFKPFKPHDTVVRKNSYCIALEDWGSEFWLVWLVHGPGTLHFIVFHDFHVGAHCFEVITYKKHLQRKWMGVRATGPKTELWVAWGWQPSLPLDVFDPTVPTCSNVYQALLPFCWAHRDRKLQILWEEIRWVVCPSLPLAAPGAASCRATFENWAAEQLRAECLCASWLVQLPAQSVVQWRPRHLHADPSGHTALTVQRSESGKGKWMFFFFFFRKNTLRMVSCAKACAKQWNCKCIQCILRVCFRIFDLGATNLTAQSRSSKGNWFQMKKLQLFEQGW